MNRSRAFGLTGLSVVLLCLGIVVGVVLEKGILTSATFTQNNSPEFRLIEEAWNTTREVYVDQNATQPIPLAYGAIAGMVDSLGDTGHSRFLTPEEVRQTRNYERGQLEGVGIEVQEKNGQVVVVAPIDNSPAQKAGIRAGDIIAAVDGKPVIDLTDAVNRILGPAGTPVTLTIKSPSGQTRDVPLIRAAIRLKSVTWSKLPGTQVVHLRIATVSGGTTQELTATLSSIPGQGATAIILDVRDNPGGLLNEAVGITSSFLKTGNVLLEKSADGTIKPVPVKPGRVSTDLPAVVLMNGGTASGAEIIAGALQDAGRARLVGTTTFGTGTVLGQFPLSDGSALLLATQEWLRPSGRTIWHKGLTPDVAVTLPANTFPLFPASEAGMTPDDLQKSGDQQLLQALDMLK